MTQTETVRAPIVTGMDIEQVWSAALGLLALTSTHLAGSRRISAWVVGMVSQCGWIGFMFLTENYGFLVSITGFTYVYIRNYLAWKEPASPQSPTIASHCCSVSSTYSTAD